MQTIKTCASVTTLPFLDQHPTKTRETRTERSNDIFRSDRTRADAKPTCTVSFVSFRVIHSLLCLIPKEWDNATLQIQLQIRPAVADATSSRSQSMVVRVLRELGERFARYIRGAGLAEAARSIHRGRTRGETEGRSSLQR